MIKVLATSFVAAAFVTPCSPPAPPQTRAAVITSSCGPRPASWGKSQMRVSLGSADTTLGAMIGAFVVDVSLDSVSPVNKPQISLFHGATHYDVIYEDSVIKIAAPAGRYVFRARMLGAQTVQDSVDVRSGFADSVEVILAREVVCLLSAFGRSESWRAAV